MRCKKIMALACALAMAISCLPVWGGVASADDITALFTHDFSDSSELELYSSNQGLSATLSISSSGSLVASFSDGDSSGWNSKHGVQTEITSYVKANSGSTFGASADFKVGNYYNGAFTLAFVAVDSSSTETTYTLASNTGTADEFTTFSGSAALTYTDGYTYYLRMTQATGYHTYDNISLYLGGVPTPDTNTLVSSTIFDDSLGLWSPYNTDDTGATVSCTTGSQAKLTASGTYEKWGDNNGVKVNITNYIKGYSGETFYLSADLQTWAWAEGVNKVKAFFEVTNSEGTTNTYSIGSAPDADTGYSSGDTVTVTGNTKLTFEDTDAVYLCFKHGAGTQIYSNLTLKATIPDSTPEVTYEELIQNGGCESVYNGSLSYWYAFGTGTVSQDSSGYEGKAGKVTGREKNWNGIAQSVSGIEGGVTYKVKAMVKTSTATTVSFTASIGYANLGQVTTAADTWTKIDTEWTASSGTDYTGVALYFQASDATADIYIDNVSVLKPVTTEEDPYTFETSSSFDTVTTDETTTGTLTFETTVNQATEDAVAAADVASYGYVAINFDNLSDGSTYNGENGTGITNIVVKSNAQDTPTGYDGTAFDYGEKYYWQVTGIPNTATRVAFWVVPYLTTNETSDNVHYGDAYKHSDTLSWE